MDGQDSTSEMKCKRCSKSIEGTGFKDGKAIYCDFKCFSAKYRRLFLVLAIFLTLIICVLIIWSDSFIEAMAYSYSDPTLTRVIYFLQVIAASVVVLWMYYTAYIGWRIIREEEGIV